MTISVDDRRFEYPGNGVATTFTGPKLFAASHLLVYVVDADGEATLQTLNTDYTLSGVNSGQQIEIELVTPHATGETLLLLRTVPYEQTTSFRNIGAFFPESHEDALDKVVQQIQQLRDLDNTTVKLPETTLSGFDTTLPRPTADYLVGVNESNTGFRLIPPSTLATLGPDFLQAGTGAQIRSVQSKLRDIVSVKDFGAVGDGVTNDDAAFALAEAAADSIYVPAGSYVLTAAPTLGVFWGEGTILVGGLTAYLHPTPGPVNEIFAEVFAPDPTGVADSAPALQRAIDFAQNNNLPLVLGAAASYRLNTGLTFKHGSNGSDPFRYAVKVVGNYATLNPQGGVRAITVVPRCLLADIATGRGDAPIYMRDLIIEGAANPATARAITVGLAGYVTSAFEVMDFTNIVVNGFTGTGVSVFVETKHALFTRWVQRAGSFEIRCSTSGGFCGDFMFEWCEWGGGTVAVPPLLMESSAGEARGIKFVGGAIYGSGTKLSATGTGAVGDIWMSGGVQFDGPDAPVNEQAMIVSATDTARVFQVHLTDVYFVSYAGACITASSSGSGTIYQFKIEGAGVGSCAVSASVGNSMFSMAGVESISIRGVEFDSVTAAAPGGLMNFDGCTNVAVQGNKATRCSTVEYMVIIGNGDKHIITDNMANVSVGVVNDYTGGAPTRLVTDNLLV